MFGADLFSNKHGKLLGVSGVVAQRAFQQAEAETEGFLGFGTSRPFRL